MHGLSVQEEKAAEGTEVFQRTTTNSTLEVHIYIHTYAHTHIRTYLHTCIHTLGIQVRVHSARQVHTVQSRTMYTLIDMCSQCTNGELDIIHSLNFLFM